MVTGEFRYGPQMRPPFQMNTAINSKRFAAMAVKTSIRINSGASRLGCADWCSIAALRLSVTGSPFTLTYHQTPRAERSSDAKIRNPGNQRGPLICIMIWPPEFHSGVGVGISGGNGLG